MIEETHFVATKDGPLGVVVTYGPGGPHPVVVMFHDGPGLREANRVNARRLAEAGLTIVMPDRYHRHGDFLHIDPSTMRGDPKNPEVVEFRKVFAATNDDQMRVDVAALLQWLPALPSARAGPLGCIGYCIGARTVLRTMADHDDRFTAGVCLHPSFCASNEPDSPHLSVPRLHGRLYVGIGDQDRLQSVEMNQPFLDAVTAAGGELDVFEGSDHGFAVPGPFYAAAAATTALGKAVALFTEQL